MSDTIREQFQQFIASFRQWSPILQLGTAIAVVIILFLFWDGTIAPTASQWEAQANTIQNQVRQVRDRQSVSREIGSLRDTIITVGEVREPTTANEGGQQLIDTVNAVMGNYSGTGWTFELRPSANLSRGALSKLTGGGQAMRLSGELRFEASPEHAIEIISALETRPEIATINLATIQRIGGRRVSVRLTLDSWVIEGAAPVRPGRSM